MPHKSEKPNSKRHPHDLPVGEGFPSMLPFETLFFETDRYYQDLGIRMLHILAPLAVELGCNHNLLSRMALSLAAYFEDQVSQLGIWMAFTHRHKELYGSWLPWYDTTSEEADYYEDEVNLQDIKFILWMICVSTQEDNFIPPFDKTIEICASEVFELLKDEFESAPANEDLARLLYSDIVTENFYKLKRVLISLTQKCYLMAGPSWQSKIRQSIRQTIKEKYSTNQGEDWINYVESSYTSLRMRIGPLALYPKEWYVLMREQRGITKDNDKILAIDSTPLYPFIIESNNNATIVLRSVRDVKYKLDSNSLNVPNLKSFKEGDIYYTMLANYDGNWIMDGMMAKAPIAEGRDHNLIFKSLREQLLRNRCPIDLFGRLDPSFQKYVNPVVKERLEKVISRHKGKRLFYFPTPLEALQWQESMLGNSFEAEDAKAFLNSFPDDERFMAFIHKDYSLFTLSQAETIKDRRNPYYIPQKAHLASELLYNKNVVPDELVAYLVQNDHLANLNFDVAEESKIYSELVY